MLARILPAAGGIVATLAMVTAFAPYASARTADEATPTTSGRAAHTNHGAVPTIACGSNNGASGAYVNSQKYAAASAPMTDTGAADFTVPAGGCVIQEAYVNGQYTGPSIATKVNILIKAGATQPTGPNLASAADKNITNFSANAFGSFKVPLPAPVTLGAGHYWLIFQVKVPVGTTWGWETTATTSGATDVWRNPGGGWGCGSAWLPINSACVANPQADFSFGLV